MNEFESIATDIQNPVMNFTRSLDYDFNRTAWNARKVMGSLIMLSLRYELMATIYKSNE